MNVQLRDYRFRFQIVDATTDEVIESDWCTITNAKISGFGECEVVEMEVSRMLRNWRGFARAEYERENFTSDEEEKI